MSEPRRPHSHAHVDELESIPGPGTLTWRPVRAHFEIRAFGCNAYTAAEAGSDVVEPHDEDPNLAHQELYFVAAGRATFTIDGDTFDAPRGTYVFVPDPASQRHAVAAEAGTTVLSFGGPPNFEPSAWEWKFRAAALRGSDPERARAILEDGRGHHPGSPGIAYEVACLEALSGDREAALAELRSAVEAEAEFAAYAREDEDFAELRDDPGFKAIVDG